MFSITVSEHRFRVRTVKPTLRGGYAGILLFGGQHRKLLGFGYRFDQGRCAHHLKIKQMK